MEYNTPHKHCFNKNTLCKLLVWRLRNQYQKVGEFIVKQIKGTGQGDNHSGHLCRLLSIYYERRFMKYWITNDINVAKQYNYTLRKHDDYLFINNNILEKHLKRKNKIPGLIPSYLKLNWTNQPPHTDTNYLDTNIHITHNIYANNKPQYTNLHNKTQAQLRIIAKQLKLPIRGTSNEIITRITQHNNPYNNYHNKPTLWNMRTYNKKTDLKVNFPIVSMPHITSNISKHTKSGTFTGQLHAYKNANYIHYEDFIQNTTTLITHLHYNNRYSLKMLIHLVKKFIKNNRPSYRHSEKFLIKALHNQITLATINKKMTHSNNTAVCNQYPNRSKAQDATLARQ